MDNNKEAEKAPKAASKSFMTVGPTLHYSHKNVQRCWLLAVVVFCVSCLFWSRILAGSFWSFDFGTLISTRLWWLGHLVVTGASIFEYPWQILVLGLLMGILAVVPVLISQLMSFRHSLLFVLAVFFLANLPAFAICLLISSFAAACRPLRFRSRFIAIALCTAPQLFYWGYFGGLRAVEPIKWGFSFAPWICAWLVCLAVAGLVLGIGHFTRYRPGLVWTFTSVVLLTAVVAFEVKIGFDELDYQLYVAKNNPEQVTEFHDHSVRELLDEIATNPSIEAQRYIERSFFPNEPILLRAKLKETIKYWLSHDRWPSWFAVPAELSYQDKREWLSDQYNLFIGRRTKSRRMPIALYYEALLHEYRPDIEVFEQEGILHFYTDYPYERSQETWYWLYRAFADSPESIEARWRIAKHWAGRGEFEEAEELLKEAQTMLSERSVLIEKQQQPKSHLSPFHPPADSVMTPFKLTELQGRLAQLQSLINPQNRNKKKDSDKHLAQFVMLNHHSPDYARLLNELLEQLNNDDPLRDNILLAQTKLIADDQLRAEKLAELHKIFQDTDGGMQALYELALLKICLWRHQDESNLELKKKYLADARTTLTSFVSLYPNSFCVEQVRKNLADLPAVD